MLLLQATTIKPIQYISIANMFSFRSGLAFANVAKKNCWKVDYVYSEERNTTLVHPAIMLDTVTFGRFNFPNDMMCIPSFNIVVL